MTYTKRLLPFLALFVFGAAAPAVAQQCGPLRLINTVPLVIDGSGRPFIPVTIGGKPKTLLFDTGGVMGTVKPSVVEEFKLAPRREEGAILYNAYGDKLDRKVTIPTLTMGRIRGGAWNFAVEPAGFSYSDNPSVAGTLAPDVFRQFDVDLDFAAKKLNLFSPDHCLGKVLYWQPKAIAILPMDLKTSGHIYVRVTIDGRSLNGLIDTGAARTVMNATAAKRVFGLDEKSPGIEKVKPSPNGPEWPTYRFKTLSLEGITVANPSVELTPDLTKKAMPFNPGSMIAPDEQRGLPDLIIGQTVLSRLHLYIAYRERKLYVTNATASP